MLLSGFKVFTFTRCVSRVSVIRQTNYHLLAHVKNTNVTRPQCVPSKRTFFWWFKKPTISKFKEIDKVSDAYQLIYRNTMERYLFWTQILTIASGVIVFGIVTMQTNYEETSGVFYEWKKENNFETVSNEFFMFLFAFTAFAVVLHMMLSKLPIRIYYLPQQQKYQFVFYGNVPFSIVKHTCQARQVVKSEETGILPWRENRYEILNGNRRIILFEHFFRKPIDYNVMLGYQKDPDCDDAVNK